MTGNAIEIGTAAEHMVCADLILLGHRAFLTGAGLPYDIIVDVGNRLLRIQVKSAGKTRNVNSAGRASRIAYTWAVRTHGKGGRKRLPDTACDVVALVALDIRIVAYFPLSVCGQTIQLIPPGARLLTRALKRTWSRSVDEFPFETAISGDVSYYEMARREVATHCRHGHLLFGENLKRDARGYRLCRECERNASRDAWHKRRNKLLCVSYEKNS